MKKLFLTIALFGGLVVVLPTANATGLRTEFKNFEISSIDYLYVGKKVQKIWTLSYSTNELPVTVIKRKTLDGTEYVVHSKHFEVSYAVSAKGFGAKEVRNSWRSVPKRINKAVISQDEMKRQQILTPDKVDDEKAIGLIASYLPDLINDGYTHLLN